MKILVLTLADQLYWSLARISNPNKAAYAAKHGYDFRAYSNSDNPARPTSWSKLRLVALALEEYDWVFWTDADSLIMNSEMKLEDLIEDKQLIVARDNNGINLGQFLASPRVYDLFIRADIHQELFNNPWWEQPAVQIEILKMGIESDIKIVDQSKLNRLIPNGPEHNTFKKMMNQVDLVWKRDDFILHFSGCGGDRAHLRLLLMEAYLEYAR